MIVLIYHTKHIIIYHDDVKLFMPTFYYLEGVFIAIGSDFRVF